MTKVVCDLDELVDHLHAEVQFYNSGGAQDNKGVLETIRKALESFICQEHVMPSSPAPPLVYEFRMRSYSDRRFALVKIAFEIGMTQTFLRGNESKSAEDIARWAVAMADAVLAEMEKKPEAGNDDENRANCQPASA